MLADGMQAGAYAMFVERAALLCCAELWANLWQVRDQGQYPGWHQATSHLSQAILSPATGGKLEKQQMLIVLIHKMLGLFVMQKLSDAKGFLLRMYYLHVFNFNPSLPRWCSGKESSC